MRHPHTRDQRRHQFFRWRARVRYYIKHTYYNIESDPMERMKQFFHPFYSLPSFVCGFFHTTVEEEITREVRWREKNRHICSRQMHAIEKLYKGNGRQTLKAKAKADSSFEDLEKI